MIAKEMFEKLEGIRMAIIADKQKFIENRR